MRTRPFDWLRARLNGEVGLYALLIVVAAILRFWDLGGRAIHHDESLYAYYSWLYLTNGNYIHDPMMHGPFFFHVTPVIYWVLGATDSTARIVPALFGTALVGMPVFLRAWLGRWGSLAAAAMLALSPSMLYFSRFARNDIFVAVWTLALVICLWRYMAERRHRYLYLGAAFLSLSFCTKETAYLAVAVIGSSLLIITGRELLSRLWRGVRLHPLSAPAEYLLLIGTLTLPLLAAGITIPLKWLGLSSLAGSPVLIAATITVLFAMAAFLGLRWDWRKWLVSALIFYGIFTLLYTALFTNPSGFVSGLWGSLDYWVRQQAVERGTQPWYYYFMILSVYEFLPLIFGVVAMVYFGIKGNLFSRFLIYWTLASLLLYSYAGEKMPWLVLYIALPLILLAGMFLGGMVEGLKRSIKEKLKGRAALRLSAVAVFAALLVATAGVAVRASFFNRECPVEMLVYSQNSQEVAQAAAEIARLAQESGAENKLAVTVDATPFGGWPWPWYLRSYSVDYPMLTTINSPPRGSVLILAASNEQMAKPFLDRYLEVRRIPLLLWFPEHYKLLNQEDLSNAQNWVKAWRYFIYREIDCRRANDAIIYFPKSLSK